MVKATGLNQTTIIPVICQKGLFREDKGFPTLARQVADSEGSQFLWKLPFEMSTTAPGNPARTPLQHKGVEAGASGASVDAPLLKRSSN